MDFAQQRSETSLSPITNGEASALPLQEINLVAPKASAGPSRRATETNAR